MAPTSFEICETHFEKPRSTRYTMAEQNRETTNQASSTTESTKSQLRSDSESRRRASTDTTRTTLPSYASSLATDTPPAYTRQPKVPTNHQKSSFQQSRNPASAATIRAIMGDPVPEEPRRSLRDRLLCRRPTYNRRPPSSERERERGSSARWNVWGSPISDPK